MRCRRGAQCILGFRLFFSKVGLVAVCSLFLAHSDFTNGDEELNFSQLPNERPIHVTESTTKPGGNLVDARADNRRAPLPDQTRTTQSSPSEWDLVPGESHDTPAPKARSNAKPVGTSHPAPAAQARRGPESTVKNPAVPAPVTRPPPPTPFIPVTAARPTAAPVVTAAFASGNVRTAGPPAAARPASGGPPASNIAHAPSIDPQPSVKRSAPVKVPSSTRRVTAATSTVSARPTAPSARNDQKKVDTPDDDYRPEPDVYPFTSSPEEISGRINAQLPAPASVETPRPPPQPFENAAFYGSTWAPWSQWSQCQTNERVRVRACHTFVGFSCFGSNKEIQGCDLTSPHPATTFPPLQPIAPFRNQFPVDRSSEFGAIPGNPKVFILSQPPGFGIPAPLPPAPFPEFDYGDYGLPPADLSPAAPPSVRAPLPGQNPSIGPQAKFQLSVSKADNDVETPPELLAPATETPARKTATKKPKAVTTTTAKPKNNLVGINFRKPPDFPSESGQFGGSVSALAGQRSVPMHVRPPQDQVINQKPLGRGKKPTLRIAAPNPQNGDASTTAASTDTTSVAPTDEVSTAAPDTVQPPGGGLVGGPPGTATAETGLGITTKRPRPNGRRPISNGNGDSSFNGGGGVDSGGGNGYQPPPPDTYSGPAPAPSGSYGGGAPIGFDQATWGNWGPWSPCTCAKRARSRACDYSTAYLTEGCDGNSYEIQTCAGSPCAPPGGFTGCGADGCARGYGGGVPSSGGYAGTGCTGSSCSPPASGYQVPAPAPSSYGSTSGCAGGDCALQGGPVVVQPPFPYPPVQPSSGSCIGGACTLQGGPTGGCTGSSCSPSSGYSAPVPPSPQYGSSGCSGGGCVLQGGISSGCSGNRSVCAPSSGYGQPVPPPSPPSTYGSSGCSGSSCSPPSDYSQPAPPPSSQYGSSGCSGGGCVLQGGASPGCSGNSSGCSPSSGYGQPVPPPAPPSAYGSSGCSGSSCSPPSDYSQPAPAPASGYGSSGCSGSSCASTSTGCAGLSCILNGPTGPINIQPGCAGSACGSPAGYGTAPAPAPAPSYSSGGCSGGGCQLQGGPALVCGAGGCGPVSPPVAPVVYNPKPASSGYGSSGCTGGGCALQGGNVPSSGCGTSGCGGYGQQPPAIGPQYKQLAAVEILRLDGVDQPLAFTAPPGQIATHPPAPSLPSAYGGGKKNKVLPGVPTTTSSSILNDAEQPDVER